MGHFPLIVDLTLSYFIAYSFDPTGPTQPLQKKHFHALIICTFKIALLLQLHGISLENKGIIASLIQKILKKKKNDNNARAILKTTIVMWLVVKNKKFEEFL